MGAEPGADVRARAAKAVASVGSGRSLDAALAATAGDLNPADRALLAAIAFGVLRDLRLLETLAAGLWQRRPAAAVRALILCGLYQLRAMRVPAHAAVHATVAAAPLIGQARAGGLINAVLRRYQREREALEAALPAESALQTSHPDWLAARLQADWPQQWRELLAANNRPAPMTLRVNSRQTTRAAYQEKLAAAGIGAAPHPYARHALVLDAPRPVTELPGFAAGEASVQDAAAQLAAPLLAIEAGMRVLDACAAPGGKTAHCLELAECDVTALDIDPERLALVEATLRRLRLTPAPATLTPSPPAATQARANLIPADATQPEQWWDGRPYDRILIDAPCTGTGVIRRHPDIKWLRRETDVAALAKRQRALLDALWPLLAPGGLLVYATCSTLRAEGASIVAEFLAATAGAQELLIDADWGEGETVGRRVAPGEQAMDGFYYVQLRKA